MADPEPTARAFLESRLRVPLADAMVAEAAGLARSVADAAHRAAAALPADARDPTGFGEILESLAPEGGASLKTRGDSPAPPMD